MTRVLITGAGGFIGGHLAAYLTRQGFAVRGFGRSASVVGFADYHQGDIRNFDAVQSAVNGCDVVVHLACSQLPPSWGDPNADFQVNALGTQHVLEAARLANIRRVIYASTGQIYGWAFVLPNRESDSPAPNSPYAASKLCGEILCGSYARNFGLRTLVLRLFNVYGPRTDGGIRHSVEAIFARKAQAGEDLLIKSHPDEARDFVHIVDVLRAIEMALSADLTDKIFNIGTGEKTTLAELARLVVDVAGSSSGIIQIASGQTPIQFQADTHRARESLGFLAQIRLEEGLKDLL